MFDPLRYDYGREIVMEASSKDRIMFSSLLDLLVAKVRQNIWALFMCIPELDIDSGGLKIIERDSDVHALYDLAQEHKTVNLYVAHGPQNLAPYYHHNLCLESSDSEVTSKKKQHEKLKKDASSMSYQELIAWAEEEARSPYLRSPPLKDRPHINDFEGKVTFTRVWNYQDDFSYDYPPLSEDEVYKEKNVQHDKIGDSEVLEVRAVDHVVVDEFVANEVDDNEVPVKAVEENVVGNVENMDVDGQSDGNIDDVVLARQKKLDKGKSVMVAKSKEKK